MRKLSVLGALLLVLLAGTVPAAAITWGVQDGNEHPNVGAIVVNFPPPYGARVVCSGTWVQPGVFLTAGHCTHYLESLIAAEMVTPADLSVSFDPDDALDSDTWVPVAVVGGIITHPGLMRRRSNPHDVGALILAEPAGVEPAELPAEGLLKDLKKAKELRPGPEGTKFTVVGYGASLQWPPPQTVPPDGKRYRAVSEYRALMKAWLLTSQNQATGDGGTCFGDSGGPVFWDDPVNGEILVAITSWGDAVCVATGMNYRVDIPDTLEFITLVTP